MITRKIFRTGNSLVIALPCEFCRAMNLRAKDTLAVIADDESTIRLKKVNIEIVDEAGGGKPDGGINEQKA